MTRLSPILAVLLAGPLLLDACKRADSSLVPLGYGPLARAEQDVGAELPPRRDAGSQGGGAPTSEIDSAESGGAASKAERPAARDEPSDAGVAQDKRGAPREPHQLPRAPSIEDWLGLYRGSDTTSFTMPDQPDRRFDDPKAKIRVERRSSDRLSFALVDSTNDKDICQLSATVDGDTASIAAGQSCFLDPEESMTVRSRPGKAIRRERHLTLDLVLDTTLSTETGDVGGTIEYHFDGER